MYSYNMIPTGRIFDIKKYAIHDGPGIRTTVFFQGCPLSCWWCHNPESQPRMSALIYRANRCIVCGECAAVCPHNAIHINDRAVTDRSKCDVCGTCAETCYQRAREVSGREVTVGEVMAEIERDVPFYDQSGGGVTFSGGEPLIQRSFLFALLRLCREREIHTVVDTSGYTTWKALESICQLVDLFLYDLKLMDEKRHLQYTGVSNRPILNNLKLLAEHGHSIHVRIPLVPGVNDDDENLRRSGELLGSLPNLSGVELMGYHDIAAAKYEALGLAYRLSETKPPSAERVQRAVTLLEEYGLKVKPSA
ncbi:MAG TPA: glycyl-radical enzyme activating protein [Anaerolineales bacterium]|nr:glycyl-radical enzyme activating protein [Anaerolineales bacterium]